MKCLIILHDPPYGSERTYNGLRLALYLGRNEEMSLRVSLMGDAVVGAKKGQKVPTGYYNVGQMLESLSKHGVAVGACGTCIDARGIAEAELVGGVHRSSMDELAAWTLEAGKVVSV